MAKRYFGNVRERASGRFQARYTGPDGVSYSAPVTFDSKQYADAWLRRVSTDIQRGTWEASSRASEGAQSHRPPVPSAEDMAEILAGVNRHDR